MLTVMAQNSKNHKKVTTHHHFT